MKYELSQSESLLREEQYKLLGPVRIYHSTRYDDDVYQVNVAGGVIGAVDIAGPVTHGAIGEHIPGAMLSVFDV